MIKHEEVRTVLNELAIQTDKEVVYQDEINGYVDTIKQYIAEQEKKDELLELYRECNKEGYFWLEIHQRINALEEALK